jgi:hypothetical protein
MRSSRELSSFSRSMHDDGDKLAMGVFLTTGNKKERDVPLMAAIQTAPYLHPRISALMTHEVEYKKPEQLTDVEWQKLITDAGKAAGPFTTPLTVEA